ncbi:MAG TPA: four-carbon acid sugar kinase family protein [Edaphobacter sp.]
MTLHNQQDRQNSTQFVIIADDLTGACDAAVAFSRRGLRTFVSWKARTEGGHLPDVFAVSTASRDIPLPLMEQRLTQAFASLDGKSQVLKKIDSVFRGNTFAEIALAVRLVPDAIVAFAPAFPDLNRFCRDGIQQVRDVSAELHIPMYDELRREGVDCVVVPTYSSREKLDHALCDLLKAGNRFFLFDSELHSDLDLIVNVLESLNRKVLWIGSGGLAQSLAESKPQMVRHASSDPLKGRVLFCIGSDHPATQRQLQDLKTHHEVMECSFSERGVFADETLIVCQVPRDAGRTAIRELIAAARTDISCVFLTGGDTAALFCEGMDVEYIEVCDQFAPGVPIGIFRGGSLTGVTVILKSGGFGETDLLTRIAERYAAKERRAVGF